MIETIISDIYDDEETSIIEIELDIYKNDDILDTYLVEFDLDKMNIDIDSDYEFQLSKDINSFVKRYYDEFNKIPSDEEIKKEFENRNYISIEL